MIESTNYDPVAELYDLYAHTDYDYAFFEEELKAGGKRVLELTSGTRRLSIPLIKAGAHLTCVDLSRGMLEVLSRKLQQANLSAHVVHSDICELKYQSEFELAILPFQSFMELIGEEKQLKALAAIFNALEFGGKFICTMHNPSVRRKAVDGALRIVGQFQMGDGTLVVSGFEQGGNPVVTRHQFFEYFDDSGSLGWKRLLRMQFQFIEKQEFQSMAEAASFSILQLYGDYDCNAFDSLLSPPDTFFLLNDDMEIPVGSGL